MRILADENFPGDAVTALRERGHDVAWIRMDAPGSSDPAVVRRARDEGRLLVTFDKDFGELAFRQRVAGLSAGRDRSVSDIALLAIADRATRRCSAREPD
jgi:hypothetical protein